MATAYCYRSGHIGIWRDVPKGAVPIAYGPRQLLKQAIGGFGRLSYDGRTYMVPGVPEADDDDAAVEAVKRFCAWMLKTDGISVPTIT
jgi:hypothetical protein